MYETMQNMKDASNSQTHPSNTCIHRKTLIKAAQWNAEKHSV